MIDKLLDRVVQAGTLRAIFRVVASLCALATVGSWVGLGSPSLDHADVGDGHLAALGGSPLAVIYRTLSFLDVPHDWVCAAGGYLAANPTRESVIGILAALVGVAMAVELSPTQDVPSLQASTWWVCAAIAVECGQFLVLALLSGVVLAIQARRKGKDDPAMSLLQLIFAAFAVALLVLPLMYDSTRSRSDRT